MLVEKKPNEAKSTYIVHLAYDFFFINRNYKSPFMLTAFEKPKSINTSLH